MHTCPFLKDDAHIYLKKKKSVQCLVHSELDARSALEQSEQRVSSCEPPLREQAPRVPALSASPCRGHAHIPAPGCSGQSGGGETVHGRSRNQFSCGLRPL